MQPIPAPQNCATIRRHGTTTYATTFFTEARCFSYPILRPRHQEIAIFMCRGRDFFSFLLPSGRMGWMYHQSITVHQPTAFFYKRYRVAPLHCCNDSPKDSFSWTSDKRHLNHELHLNESKPYQTTYMTWTIMHYNQNKDKNKDKSLRSSYCCFMRTPHSYELYSWNMYMKLQTGSVK